MCSILLPKGVLDILDSKRRAFLWTGSTSCTGASCKAPWDLVCLPKEKGGLGIPDLPVQNKCLLNKFLVKLLAPSSAPWHMWFSAKYSWSASCDLGDDRYTDTAVWRGIRDGLSDFRSATSVQVGSGLSTFFWLDQWLGGDTLAATFPALFSHCLRPNASVAMAMSCFENSSSLHLRPRRLTLAASQELDSLLSLLTAVSLSPGELDSRRFHNVAPNDLSASTFYRVSFSLLPNDAFATCIWRNAAPPRCKSFIWLLHHRKLNTNPRLCSRGADNDGSCAVCNLPEDATHLFLHCTRAQCFWGGHWVFLR